jgi:hypothetical protein
VAALIFLVLGPPIIGVVTHIFASSQQPSKTDTQFLSAFLLVQEAEIAGGQREKIQELAGKLNAALELLEKADEAKLKGDLNSAQTSSSSASGLLEDIVRTAEVEKTAAQEKASQLRTLTIILVPVLSVIVTVVVSYVLRYARKRSIERLFKMRIEVKRGKENEV